MDSNPRSVYADLSDADLDKAHLYKANLSKANLRAAKLYAAHLGSAVLTAANLKDAQLQSANLIYAKLTGADLTGALLNVASLHGANLSGANLNGADLLKTDFIEAVFDGTDFSGARLFQTIFGYSYLRKAIGLDQCQHGAPSIIDPYTLSRSGNLPISFLRGCGLPEPFIEYLPSLTGTAIQFYSCFISYSAKDQVFADRLYADLQNKGVRCWFAPHDLPIGANTWDAIDEAIRLRDKLLVILSEASIASVRARQSAAHEAGRGVAEGVGDGPKALPLDAVMPVGDDRPVLCTDPHQRRLRMGQFEIKADRDDLRDAPAVIELEHRNRAFRVDRAEFRRELLAGAQIDLHGRHGDPFFRQEDADATRVWRELES